MYINEAVKIAIAEGKGIKRPNAVRKILIDNGWHMTIEGSKDWFAPTYDDLVSDDWEVVEVDENEHT